MQPPEQSDFEIFCMTYLSVSSTIFLNNKNNYIINVNDTINGMTLYAIVSWIFHLLLPLI